MKPEYLDEQQILLNDGWLFTKESPQAFAPVEIPHDWLIAEPQNLYQSGVGLYKRALDASFLEPEQRLYLCFDGVYMDCTVLVNGRLAGEWKHGSTAFSLDITALVTPDCNNEILVRVNYQSPNARWYTGAGIYRDVSLLVKNACHIAPDGVYISTVFEQGAWRYEAQAEVVSAGEAYEVRHSLAETEAIQAWDIDNPKLYTLCSELFANGAVADRVYTRFGFRTLQFTPDQGFSLNGRHVKIKGVCLHGDLGGLGAAVHKDALRRQLTLMRRMGANAVRTAHNPPAKALMELTDELGLLVMSEITDVWRHAKTANDYARFFDSWIEKDVAAWVRRDRNHPSLILWSLGNEIPDTHIDAEEGIKTIRYLTELIRRHDPNENAAVTLCSNYLWWENTQRCADVIKLIGYNYAEALYTEHHKAHPDWILFGSETASSVQSRGVYHFPADQPVLSEDDLQCSSLGNSLVSWGTKNLEDCVLYDLYVPYSLGQFVWTGQDYIGEPTPYQTKSSYFGHADTAGFPKDTYYLFQAGWTAFETQPVVHLYPIWDFSPGQLIDIRVCTNAPAVELFLNGQSLGRRDMNGRLLAAWQAPYRPGVLRAVAYDGQGRAAAQAERRSFGEAYTLTVSDEVYGELHFFTVSALDRDGNPVENANRRVQLRVTGGRLLALDNGDSADFEPYQQTDNRRMFSGKLLVIVRAEAGKTPEVTATLRNDDVPIRKVELARNGDVITASVFPPDATYADLIWRVANAAGIDSPLASLAVHGDGRHATLVQKGDGVCFVRCSPKNGREHAASIAMLRVEIAGKGRATLDPYAFVPAGLYGASNRPLETGIERGVATPRTGESHVGFRDLDFGDFGADTFELPLFIMENDPLPFEVWEGMPGEGGQKLADFTYELGSVWAVYQTAVFMLPKRLKGVATLCFVFRRMAHIKGFQFRKPVKAYQLLHAADCDSLYGDKYSINSGAIERIGNNVSVEFRGMDFGPLGADRLELCWRSDRPKNAVQILFSNGRETRRVMLEVGPAPVYEARVFALGESVLRPANRNVCIPPRLLFGSENDLVSLRRSAGLKRFPLKN